MQPSRPLLIRGILGRTIDELKRQTASAVRQEGIHGPQGSLTLLDFRNHETIALCKTMHDGDIGGFSSVKLDTVPRSSTEPGHVRFNGNISTELPLNRPNIQRSGYAAWRSRDRPPTLFGRSLWNIDLYTYLGLRVKSDGRRYFVNIQSETIVPTDLHQHRLHAKAPGDWETIMIKWNDFVRTNHGMVVEPQSEMPREKVRSIGIGLTDRVPGPFDLSISCIWATNDPHTELPEEPE